MHDRPLLYYITDRKGFAEDEPARRRLLLARISEAAQAGVDYIQLREKDLPTRDLESLAREAVQILNQTQEKSGPRRTALLINSRIDVAVAAQADGIHLRGDDVSPHDAAAIWKCGAGALSRELSRQAPLIGVSCHSPAEVARASHNGATFAVFGPVFEKKDAPVTPPKGLIQLKQSCDQGIPVLALGGITVENARFCFDAGASGIAAIRLFQENDVAAVVRRFRSL